MVKYDLQCNKGHGFEGWFSSISAFDEQSEKGLLQCPVCESTAVSKALMAPNIGSKSNRSENTKTQTTALAVSEQQLQATAEVRQALETLHAHVKSTSDYVGKDFAEEARKIHYGETEDRSIYGETTLSEAKDLIDEGVEIIPLPEIEKAN